MKFMQLLKKVLVLCLLLVAFVSCKKTKVYTIEVELYPAKTPITVANFYKYVDNKFFDGTIFHRVMNNFMIQGGGFTKDLTKKRGYAPIKNEADKGIDNDAGTIAMARTSVIDSATNQFFINVKDNKFLNFKDDSQRGYGYCAFGKVVSGMDVVNKIKMVKVGRSGYHANVPVEPVMIKSIKRSKTKKDTVVIQVAM